LAQAAHSHTKIIRQAPPEAHTGIRLASKGFPLDSAALIEILIIVLNFITEQTGTMTTVKAPTLERYQTLETRCECGQLIAKVCGRGLELKCKRCKRIVVIPFSSIEGWGTGTS
jgi:phage FluMu protein Com